MRRHYLDNIRWITVVLVVLYHVIYMYNGVAAFGVIGPHTQPQYQDAVLYLLHPWFMALLFIIAGISSRIYLEKHTIKEFVAARSRKLLVPSTLGLLLYGFVQGYISMQMSDAFSGEMGQMPKPILYIIMTLSGTSILWFLQLLWFFSMILALIRKLEKGRLYELCAKVNFPIVLLLGVLFYGSSLILNTPMVVVYRFGYYGLSFLLGYFVFAHEEVIDRLAKWRFALLPAALIAGGVFTWRYFGENYADPFIEPYVCKSVLFAAFAWLACLAFLACGKQWLNYTNNITEFMKRRSFGLYMFHYLGLSAAALALDRFTEISPVLCYFIAGAASVAAGLIIPLVIEKIPVLRYFIMGIKKPKKTPAGE